MNPGPHTVVVVTVPLDSAPPAVVLDDDERRQAERFVRAGDRERYVASHGALRAVLGRCLETAPGDVRFAYGPHGKPRVANASIDLRFNLSHSGDRALVALAQGREVGIDIEQTRVIADLFGTAADAFSRIEQARLGETPREDQHDVFFRIWTRKESFIKALGDGLHFPLSGFDVSAEPAARQLLLACAAAPRELGRWTTRSVPCEPGYTAAITVEGDDFDLRLHPLASYCDRGW